MGQAPGGGSRRPRGGIAELFRAGGGARRAMPFPRSLVHLQREVVEEWAEARTVLSSPCVRFGRPDSVRRR